jgi:hypothetical protein
MMIPVRTRVFGWRAAGAERSGSAPAAVWTRSDGSGAAPEGIYPLDAGRLRPLKFGGRSGSAPVFLTVSLPSHSRHPHLSSLSGASEAMAPERARGRRIPRAASRASAGARPRFLTRCCVRCPCLLPCLCAAGATALGQPPRRSSRVSEVGPGCGERGGRGHREEGEDE